VPNGDYRSTLEIESSKNRIREQFPPSVNDPDAAKIAAPAPMKGEEF
jgi:hypothetical protein